MEQQLPFSFVIIKKVASKEFTFFGIINLCKKTNYTQFNESYQLVLPLNLECLIPEDDFVRLLSHILEGLDYTELYHAYSSTGRKPAVEPQIMFKLLIYAYSQNIYSSTKIEKACHRDIHFKWLLAGQKAPDPCSINRFRNFFLPDEVIYELFYQQIKYLAEHNEILFENVFIDGTKIEANANRYTFVWKKSLNKNEEKMFSKVVELVTDINMTDSWCYLASVMDLHTRKIIGYSFSRSMDTAIIMTTFDSQSPLGSLIFHSYLGTQYTSVDFIKQLRDHNVTPFYSMKGCP